MTMTVELPESVKKYIDNEKVFATLATASSNGSVHTTVIWLKREGDDLLFSTTTERAQGRNLLRDPRATVMIVPPENPYTYAEIRGTITTTPDPDRSLPDELSYKYTGKDYKNANPTAADDGPVRIIVRLTPNKIVSRM